MSLLSYNGSALAILVVDDDDAVLSILKAAFLEDGHTVGLAGDGEEALSQFRERRWDIVVTDRNMPKMNGEELGREIKRLSPRTPVVMVTGFAPRGCCSGVDAVVRKPFKRAFLVETINQCLAAAHGGFPSEDGVSAAA